MRAPLISTLIMPRSVTRNRERVVGPVTVWSSDDMADVAITEGSWDAFVAAAPHGYHEQTWLYGELRRQYGFEVHRVAVQRGGRIVAGAQMLARRTPIGRLAVLWRGPNAIEDHPDLLDEAVEAIDEEAERRGLVSIRVDTLPTQAAARSALERRGFSESEAWTGSRRSLVIPLVGDDEMLLSQIRRKTRYNMRLAGRAGVQVSVHGDELHPAFYELYLESSRHNSFVPFPQEYFRRVWEAFAPHGRAVQVIASLGGRAVSILLCMVSGRRLYPSWIGTDRAALERNLQVAGLMYYEAMRWGRDQGCELLDFQDAMPYKRLFSESEVVWPSPLRQFYGPLRGIRWRLLEASSSIAWLRRLVFSAASRNGLRPRMPY